MRNIFVLVSCVLVAFTVQGHAKEAYKNKTVAVDYADLDLSNPADAEVLRQRVDRAVKKACKTPYDNGMVLGTNRDKRRCMIWTREQAMAAISNETQLASRPSSVRADRQVAEVAIPNQVANREHEQRVVQLSWRNKDLSQERDLREVHAAINESVEDVCDSPVDQGAGVSVNRDKQRCLDQARGAAYAAVPGSTARLAALDGQPAPTVVAQEQDDESLWDWFVTILK